MSDRPKNIDEFVAWFRNTSPYINAHRGKTFVVYFHGEVIGSDPYLGLIQDLILLNTLGVRIVLVHGAEPQIDTHLDALQIKTRRVNGLRITDNIVLPHVKAVLGSMRMDIETLLSRGVINTPNLGLQVHVAGGNFVTAQPLGVIDGVDFHHTGQVRKIDTQSISNRLSENNIVLLSPLGYSPTGEIFSLSGLELASKTAVALKADKLILLGEDVCIRDSDDSPIYQMNLREAEHRLEALSKSGNHSPRDFQFATEACRLGVRRVHLLDQNQDGALLIELFTRDGTGTLISSANYDTVRQATIDDIAGILELIRPLEESGVLVRRSRERLETEIDYFTVMERDGMIIACAALYRFPEESVGELACLAVHKDYAKEGRGASMLAIMEQQAIKLGMNRLFVLTTHTPHWFVERGYVAAELKDLPVEKQALYNYQRRSKVFLKSLDLVRHSRSTS